MKIGWGKAIVIAFALFITFIMYFVFKVQSDSKYDNELVTEEYYKKEALTQGNLDKQNRANALSEKVTIISNTEGISINFPSNFDYKNIKGKVFLYRPSNQKLDFEVPISLSNSHLLIPKSNLVGGLWNISVEWSYNGVEYLNKDSMILN